MSEQRERIVIVGASLAGIHAANELREQGFDGELTIIGDEPHPPYDRPPLSKELLSGSWEIQDALLPLHEALDAEWRLGAAATGLDLQRRVVLVGADEVPFDGLVVATGARPRTLPAFGTRCARVHVLRTLEDSLALRAALARGSRVLIVGAGFVGVEVATVAQMVGCDVTIVSLDPPLALAGGEVSTVCVDLLRAAGVRLHVGRTITAVEHGSDPAAVMLDDGTPIAFDLALVAVGATPNVEWLTGSGLLLDDGVVCDASLAAVGAVAVVAAGDVASWPNPTMGGARMRIEHWSNAVQHGVAAARTLLHGPGAQTAHGSVPDFWSDHLGTRLQSVGVLGGAVRYELIEGSLTEHRFAATAHDADGRLVGAVAYGMPRAIARCREAIVGRGIAA